MQTAQPQLPPLIKQSSTYKLFVPRKVEEKIRYLIRKFPSTEWSGVLFYNHTGSFETNDLEIHCEDIFPMDLGSGTFTDFKMDESVVGYIAENIDLFGCDTGLVHSHHHMGAFFSGTDTSTLRAEGNDTNCFVSLIVDTKGTYQAAVTRKVKVKKEIITTDLGSSYEFFGEGTHQLKVDEEPDIKTIVDDENIEYFMLDVQIESVDNPLKYLDTRFEEIEQRKKKVVVNPPVVQASNGNHSPWIPNGNKSRIELPDVSQDNDYSFREWLNSDRRKSAEAKESLYGKEQTLFSEEEMAEMADVTKWEPDPTIIHHLVCQMVCCSLIVNDNLDLKQWITRWMDKKYKEIFGSDCDESVQFNEWKEFIVEFLITQYNDDNVPAELYDDWDLYQSKIASAMYNELYQYSGNQVNPYIEAYNEVLARYIYE